MAANYRLRLLNELSREIDRYSTARETYVEAADDPSAIRETAMGWIRQTDDQLNELYVRLFDVGWSDRATTDYRRLLIEELERQVARKQEERELARADLGEAGGRRVLATLERDVARLQRRIAEMP
jgi:hypothetical protein